MGHRIVIRRDDTTNSAIVDNNKNLVSLRNVCLFTRISGQVMIILPTTTLDTNIAPPSNAPNPIDTSEPPAAKADIDENTYTIYHTENYYYYTVYTIIFLIYNRKY